MTNAFPLHWPQGWTRTPKYRQKRSKFKTAFGKTRDSLLAEIRRMNGTLPILSTNIPITKDGLPYAKHRIPDDCGVAVYFKYKGKQMVFASDHWDKVEDNMHAIRLTIEALRGIERWGASEMLERSFQGFTASERGRDKKKMERSFWNLAYRASR